MNIDTKVQLINFFCEACRCIASHDAQRTTSKTIIHSRHMRGKHPANRQASSLGRQALTKVSAIKQQKK
jgi:hypothetical protein